MGGVYAMAKISRSETGWGEPATTPGHLIPKLVVPLEYDALVASDFRQVTGRFVV